MQESSAKRTLIRGLVLAVAATCCGTMEAEENEPAVIPRPMELKRNEGPGFVLNGKTAISCGKEAQGVARYLRRTLSPATGFEFEPGNNNASGNSIILALDDSLIALGDEGYRLEVSARSVAIRAMKPAGLFYGVQTLRQLLPVEIEEETRQSVEWVIPAVSIMDKPRFPWRGMLLDPSRHFFSVDYVKKYVDTLAMHKMNRLQLHLTDDQGWRLEIRKYPRLTEIGSVRKADLVPGKGRRDEPYGGFYTQEEIREIVSYAAERFVTVVPEIEMPGHSVAALASYPHLGCTGGPYEVWVSWGVSKDVQCAGKETTFVFLEDVLTEVMALFPGKYIHVGGDEAPVERWKACPHCQKRIKREGLKNERELQVWFTRRIDRFLRKNGRTLVGWADFLEGGEFPDATIMAWRGRDRDALGTTMKALNAGQNVVRTTGTYCYFDYLQARDPNEPPGARWGCIPLERVYECNPHRDIPEDKQHMVIGSQGNLWTEHIAGPYHADYMAYPRATALAEVLWSPQANRDYADFLERLEVWLPRLRARGVNYRKPTGGSVFPMRDATSLTTGKPAT